MLLRKAIKKTKTFFHKSLQNFKSLVFGGYQKLPKSRPLDPLYCGGNNSNQEMQQLDQFYRDFSEMWESDNEKMKKNKKNSISAKAPMKEKGSRKESTLNFEEENSVKNNQDEERAKEMKKMGSYREGKRGEPPCPVIANGGGGYVLAQKMKELEMTDMSDDVDHALDIEEVLHYYSRLSSPVYLNIVNKFFMDMYSDFLVPQTSAASITNSSRRLGPLKF